MQPPPPADGRPLHLVHPGLQTLGPNPAQGGPAPPQGPPPVRPGSFGGRAPPGWRGPPGGQLSGRSNGGQALPPPLPPPKTHAELVAEYKELLLESQVCCRLCTGFVSSQRLNLSHRLSANVSTARESCMNVLFAQDHCRARDRPVTIKPDVLQDGALRLPKSLRGLSCPCIVQYHSLYMASCFSDDL